MRQYLIFALVILCFSCQNDDPTPEEQGTSITLRVRQGDTPETSEIVSAYMWIWKMDSVELQIPDPLKLLADNETLDSNEFPRVAQVFKRRLTGVFVNQLDTGKYYIATMLEASGRYSTTQAYLETIGQEIVLDKLFSLTGNDFEYEQW